MTTTPKPNDPVEAVPVVVREATPNLDGSAGPTWVPVGRAAVSTPTQVRRPWRSTARTVFQAFIGLCVLAPLLVQTAGLDVEQLPWLAVVLGVAAAITRIMAIPGVEVWLRRFLPFLAAAPAPPVPDERGEVSWLGVVVIVLLVILILLLAGPIRIG